jgi:hypothetical protein
MFRTVPLSMSGVLSLESGIELLEDAISDPRSSWIE